MREQWGGLSAFDLHVTDTDDPWEPVYAFRFADPSKEVQGIFVTPTFRSEGCLADFRKRVEADPLWQESWRPTHEQWWVIYTLVRLLNALEEPSAAATKIFS